MRLLALSLTVAALGAAPLAAEHLSGEARLEKMLAGRVAGRPMDCLPPAGPSVSSTKIEGVGMVYGSGRRIYVNRFDGGCPSLTAFDTVVTRTSLGRLCRGDIASIVDLPARMEHGSCVLGAFTPYDRAK